GPRPAAWPAVIPASNSSPPSRRPAPRPPRPPAPDSRVHSAWNPRAMYSGRWSGPEFVRGPLVRVELPELHDPAVAHVGHVDGVAEDRPALPSGLALHQADDVIVVADNVMDCESQLAPRLLHERGGEAEDLVAPVV